MLNVLRWTSCLCMLALAGFQPQARAQTSPDGTEVHVLDTWPAGASVSLGRNQNFYLHLSYTAHQPTHLWVQPMYRGKQADAGTSGSPIYSGKGEAVVWFFLMSRDAKVDEIRIQTGDGGPGAQPTVLVWQGDIRQGVMTSDAPNPAWLDRMMPELAGRAAQPVGQSPSMPRKSSLASVLLVTLFWLPSLLVPLAAAWFLRGSWRLAMLVPVAGMLFVTLRFAIDVYRDATSHNLWPFELAIYTFFAFGYVALLMVAWGIAKARSKPAPPRTR